ncbi:MAG: hypothetical protein A2283_08280 [Lentisphaerae bacterium RIFOXYA12_FULL_48_11]|nr:MAG: hypothetical protein A2283_08280 [Lentisphaerae bacterium RIFOXYA12_FULL_48_11]
MRIIIIAFMAMVCTLTCAIAAGKIMSVQVEKGDLRSSPSALSAIVASVKYGDKLTIMEEQNKCCRVTTADGKEGWIHSSALTKDKIELAAVSKDAKTGASTGEMALAGKGFTPQVEAQYKAKHADIDFTWIDKMAKMKVSTKEVLDFLKEGGITLPEGGAK